GSGFVVMTAGNTGDAISQVYQNNKGELPAAPDLSKADVEDLKFAYNVAWWHGEYNHSQKGPRHISAGSDPVDGLITRWQEPVGGIASVPTLAVPFAAPLVAEGLVYSVQPFQ